MIGTLHPGKTAAITAVIMRTKTGTSANETSLDKQWYIAVIGETAEPSAEVRRTGRLAKSP